MIHTQKASLAGFFGLGGVLLRSSGLRLEGVEGSVAAAWPVVAGLAVFYNRRFLLALRAKSLRLRARSGRHPGDLSQSANLALVLVLFRVFSGLLCLDTLVDFLTVNGDIFGVFTPIRT